MTTYRNPQTGQDFEVEGSKLGAIVEQGGFVKVTASTPKVTKAAPGPLTVQEHVAAAKAAEKAAPVAPVTSEKAPASAKGA